MAITLDGSNGVNVGTSGNTTGAVVINSALTGTEKQLALRDATNGWTRKIGVDSSNNMGFYDGDTERMRIDSSGRVTMPYQPAFLARGNSTTTVGSNYADLIYPLVDFNNGNHYNSTTGRFTAPVSGYYVFTGHIVPTANSQNAPSEFFVEVNNGSQTGRVFLDRRKKIEGTSENTFSLSGSAVLYLSQNDFVNLSHVNITSTATIEGSSVFSGYLLG